MPCWFSITNTFWNEARRLKLTNSNSPSLIYHYTNLEGFVGIVQSRSMWLTDYSYLNDKRELTHGIETIRAVIAEMLKKTQNDTVAKLLQTLDQEIAAPTHRVCIASFSAENDSLSQWRAYGSIAIGIKPNHLPLHALYTDLRAVEYDQSYQQTLTNIYINHIVQAYEADLLSDIGNIASSYHKIDRFIELAAFFKDPAFRTEQEYRLAYIEYPELRSLGVKFAPKRFRVAKSKLLPYVDTKELAVEGLDRPLEIQEVVLGPETDELLERGVREFLNCNQMQDVVVRRSTVPFRT